MNKPSDSISCSHDKLFKETWSNLENARSFLENYLSAELLEILDLNSLEICKGSFVEKSLKEYYSDLLYKVRANTGHAYIYFLFEHKSYPDSLIHLQLLKYMTGIWQLDIKQNKTKTLDVIVPLVMYHGKSDWTAPERFSGLFHGMNTAVQPFIPDFRYILFDLPRYSDDQIRGTILSRIVMLMFKYVFNPDFERNLPGILRLLTELIQKETGLQYIESLVRYLLSNMENMTGDKLKTIVERSVSGKEGGIIMEYADSALGKEYHKGMQQGMSQGLQQGMSQGLQQGMSQGLKETACDLIDVKFGNTPDAERMKQFVQNIDELAPLKAVKDKIKTATSIEELRSIIGH